MYQFHNHVANRRQSVITVETSADAGTLRMLQNIYSSPSFHRYEIDHCFFEGAQTTDELFDTLSEAVNRHEKPILLFHTGLQFAKKIEPLRIALIRLKAQFPGLMMGIQRRQLQDRRIITLMSNQEVILQLEKIFFPYGR